MSDDELSYLASLPPACDEHIVVTPDFFVYETDYSTLRFFKEFFKIAATVADAGAMGRVSNFLFSLVDPGDTSLWVSWDKIASIEADRFERTLASLFGTRSITFQYYTVFFHQGPLCFVQLPVNIKTSRKQYQQMLDAINTLGQWWSGE